MRVGGWARHLEGHRAPGDGGGEPECEPGAVSLDVPAACLSARGDPECDDHDGDRPGDTERGDLVQGWPDPGRGGGRRRDRACRCGDRGRRRQIRHARRDRYTLASGRLRRAGDRRGVGRQRADQPRDVRGVGRAFVLAAGSADSARDRGRDHHDRGSPRVGQSHRRPERGAEARAGPNGAGNEVPGRPLRVEDGVRGEPEAGVRAASPGALDPHGQHGRVPGRVCAGGGLPPQVGQLEPGSPRGAAGAEPAARDAGGGAARQRVRADPLLSRG